MAGVRDWGVVGREGLKCLNHLWQQSSTFLLPLLTPAMVDWYIMCASDVLYLI